MRIEIVRCLKDNVSYLMVDEPSRTAIAIDPGEAEPFMKTLSKQRLKLVAVLTTHHHYDHIGGLSELPETVVWSSNRDFDRIPGAGGSTRRRAFSDGETRSWNELAESPVADAGIEFRFLSIPGHTEGQFAILGFHVSSSERQAHCFVGDTLFSFGCGRCLEGTPEILFESLQKIKRLPPETKIYFGHEYSARNAEFWLLEKAQSTDTSVLALVDEEAMTKVLEKIGDGVRAAPTLAEEMNLNPFLKIKNATEFKRWRSRRDKF